MTQPTDDKPKKSPRKVKLGQHNYPTWAPRFWHGMPFGKWMGMLASNGFRIHPFRAPTAFAITVFSVFNSLFRGLTNLIHGRAVAKTEVKAPVFIVGHWRSGTTYLHELMVLDERYGYPTTYQCFAPHFFLLTEGLITSFGNFLIPNKRPMDNMESGWNRPQEDEFALCAMGVRTPYVRMAFPNTASDVATLNMEGLSDKEMASWKQALLDFMKVVTYRTGKPLILKSPPHTGRIQTIYELFPDAKFIHIVRDPYVVFPSTQRLWQRLDDIQGMQRPHFRELDEYIFSAFERMYDGFEKQRPAIPEDRLVEVKYEDLVQNPVEELERIYSHLDLGDFESIRELLTAKVANEKDYKTNKHELSDELREEIKERWSGFIERYGY
jgi:hypothetical protein